MELQEIKSIVEALLYVADQPVSIETLQAVLGETAGSHGLEAVVREIGADYAARLSPMELKFIAGGWQFATRREFSPWIRKLYREKTVIKLSTSALETLSVIAYKQPITRSEIEEIRGVEVSGVVETLLERKLIKIVGRKETIGRPLLYGTTQEFLRHFGLTHLSELPSITDTAQEGSADTQTGETPASQEMLFEQPGATEQDPGPANPEEAPSDTSPSADSPAGPGHAPDPVPGLPPEENRE